jgi:hypothetical protein
VAAGGVEQRGADHVDGVGATLEHDRGQQHVGDRAGAAARPSGAHEADGVAGAQHTAARPPPGAQLPGARAGQVTGAQSTVGSGRLVGNDEHDGTS